MKLKPNGLDTHVHRDAYATALFKEFAASLDTQTARTLAGKFRGTYESHLQTVEGLKLEGPENAVTDRRLREVKAQLDEVNRLLVSDDPISNEENLYRFSIIANLSFVGAELRSLSFTLDSTVFASREPHVAIA